MISDIGNDVPADKVFGELICEDIIDNCVVHRLTLFSVLYRFSNLFDY